MILASWAHQLCGRSLLASKVMAHPSLKHPFSSSKTNQLAMLRCDATTSCADLAGLLHYHILFNYIAQFHMFLFWRDSGSSLKRKQGFQVGSC